MVYITKVKFVKSLAAIAVLNELVDKTLENDFAKASNGSVWDWFFIKKTFIKVFPNILL